MRRPSHARVAPLSIGAVLAAALAVPACDRREEPAPAPAPTTASSPSARPYKGGPPPADSTSLPAASREPDWGLDLADPAKDYVQRYLRATKRYGAQSKCVVVGASKFTGERSVVETHNDAGGACGKAGELRDRFFVTVATDRMSLDESLHPAKLQSWPDGSDPAAAPAKVADVQDLRAWKIGLGDTLRKLLLVPLRVQLYGRGTFPVVSIAGWHGPVLRTMSPAELADPAKKLCDANEGEPLGIIAGVDRATLLRITCPAGAKFETL